MRIDLKARSAILRPLISFQIAGCPVVFLACIRSGYTLLQIILLEFSNYLAELGAAGS